MRQGTDEAPMRDLIDAARSEEQAGLLASSVFGGFPHADIHDAGLSVVTVADGDRRRAEAARDRILDLAWQRRADFVYRSVPARDALARAKHLQEGPILLLDHCDNCGSGGAQDVMVTSWIGFDHGTHNQKGGCKAIHLNMIGFRPTPSTPQSDEELAWIQHTQAAMQLGGSYFMQFVDQGQQSRRLDDHNGRVKKYAGIVRTAGKDPSWGNHIERQMMQGRDARRGQYRFQVESCNADRQCRKEIHMHGRPDRNS